MARPAALLMLRVAMATNSLPSLCMIQRQAHLNLVQPLQQQRANAAANATANATANASWQPPDWFGGFDAGESTYTEDADFGRQTLPSSQRAQLAGGWAPALTNPFAEQVVQDEWFHESRSGDTGALQSHYPGGVLDELPWYQNEAGEWHQAQVPPPAAFDRRGAHIPADWFESRINKFDFFGRPKVPETDTPELLTLMSYTRHPVNGTMSCNTPGCTATTNLQAFDPATQEARHCRLNVQVVATDFDNLEGGEWVDWIQVNGVNLSVQCFPMASGCNPTNQEQYYPCVADLDLTTVMPANGSLVIAAKIPISVDECPYKGAYLFARPAVECFVKNKTRDPEFAFPVPTQEMLSTQSAIINNTLVAVAPVQCAHRGCVATTTIFLARQDLLLESCTLTFVVNQTDFDNDVDPAVPTELIEYVNVSGQVLATNLNPGKNPCKSADQGTVLTPDQIQYKVLDKVPINVNSTSDSIDVFAQISWLVDECPSQGYLLDGLATVECLLNTTSAAKSAGPAPLAAPSLAQVGQKAHEEHGLRIRRR